MAKSEVITGDCIEVMRTIESQSVDLVFCDPPYNQGVNYGKGGNADNLSPGAYLKWSWAWISQAHGILSPTGSLWVLISEGWADEIGRMLSEWSERRNRIIWRERFGQYQEGRFSSGHRHLFYHVNGPTFIWNPDAIRVPSVRMQMGDKRATGPRVPDDVWDVSRLQGNDSERIMGHPCQLRQWPLQRIILACTNPGDLVCDPMCGSGTTGVVAARLGRNFLGVEQNADYAEMARQRIVNPEALLPIEDAPGQGLLFE